MTLKEAEKFMENYKDRFPLNTFFGNTKDQLLEFALKLREAQYVITLFGVEEKEIVICAAVKTEDGRIFRGHRHSDCFQAMQGRHLKPSYDPEEQGFITSKNRYVGRTEAYDLQRAAEIPSADTEEGYTKGRCLYSEDLY